MRRFLVVAALAAFTTGLFGDVALAQGFKETRTIINLDQGSPGGTRTVTGNVKASGHPIWCQMATVNLYVNDVLKDTDYATHLNNENGAFSVSATDASGTWLLDIPKYKNGHRICLATHKSFEVP